MSATFKNRKEELGHLIIRQRDPSDAALEVFAGTPAAGASEKPLSLKVAANGDASISSLTLTTPLPAASGGTGDNTAAATGVPRITTGNWTYDAGISHLAASTSAALASVLSDETGTGLAVFDTGATVNLKIGNAIRYANRFAGADMGAKIAAAITDLPATGGTVDAREFVGAQSLSANLTLNKANVTLLLNPGVQIDMVANGIIISESHVRVVADASAPGWNTTNGAVFRRTTTSASPMVDISPATLKRGIELRNLTFNNEVAADTGTVIRIGNGASQPENSILSGLSINSADGIGIDIIRCQNLLLDHINAIGNKAVATSIAIRINNAATWTVADGITIRNFFANAYYDVIRARSTVNLHISGTRINNYANYGFLLQEVECANLSGVWGESTNNNATDVRVDSDAGGARKTQLSINGSQFNDAGATVGTIGIDVDGGNFVSVSGTRIAGHDTASIRVTNSSITLDQVSYATLTQSGSTIVELGVGRASNTNVAEFIRNSSPQVRIGAIGGTGQATTLQFAPTDLSGVPIETSFISSRWQASGMVFQLPRTVAGHGFNFNQTDGTQLLYLDSSNRNLRRNASATSGTTQAVVTKTLTDNVATNVATITNTNEAGSADGGGYSVTVEGVLFHGGTTAGQNASRAFKHVFSHINIGAGGGFNTAVTEHYLLASIANNAGARDIGAVTMTVVQTSDTVVTIVYTVDATGTSVTTLTLHALVSVFYGAYTTAPVIAVA